MARFNGMPGNANNTMKRLQKTQKQMKEQAKAFESREFKATTGDGAVRVTVIGSWEISKITLDKGAVDLDDVEMLEDLVKAATDEALHMAEAENQQMMDKLTGRLPLQIKERIFMDYYGKQITRLMEEFSALLGAGRKSTQRLMFHIINMPTERVASLTDAIRSVRQNVRYYKECFTLTDEELCPICKSAKRNHRQIMTVESTKDLATYEKTRKYEGVYHVLRGAIPPMFGTGPSNTKLKELVRRLESDMEEVVITTSPNLEGETIAMYIAKLVKSTDIKVSRIASGVPVGDNLEYIDEITLPRAPGGRTEL